MKLISPNVQIIEQGVHPGFYINDVYKQIELCGRTCYKSEDKITDESAWPFVSRMISSDHTAMLEHGTVYLTLFLSDPSKFDSIETYQEAEKHFKSIVSRYAGNAHSRVHMNQYEDYAFITTNLRVIVQNNWLDDLAYISAPSVFHERRVTVKFTCDIGVSREFNRHRVNSMAEQSTRYCNYAKDKFGGECSFSFVPWADTHDATIATHNVIDGSTIIPYDTTNWNAIDWWLWSLEAAETAYMKEIELGWKPQQARVSLPLNTATELVHTAFLSDWMHFIDLRSKGTTGAPHPQAKELADMLVKEFISHKIIEQPI